MMFGLFLCLASLSSRPALLYAVEESCTADSCMKSSRFMLYEVNPGEGFNLRRDVFVRAAVFVHMLNELDDRSSWALVLPPWGPLYHWKRKDLRQDALHWSLFFDIDSIRRFVPVMEFDDYLADRKLPVIDEVFYLMSHNFDEVDLQSEWLLNETKCSDVAGLPYFFEAKNVIRGWFWDYDGIYTKRLRCFKALGPAGKIITRLLAKTDVTDKAVMFDRFETVLHDHYGSENYWKARRSMRFSKRLINLGNEFRENNLNSSDERDITITPDSWEIQKSPVAFGGPFVCAHLRRQDYLRAHADEVPSVREAALQLRKILRMQNISVVFLATDEVRELKQNLPGITVWTYNPSQQLLSTIKEGGAAIVEQWICAHARFFIGSHESTFSFRIQEEREILGFDPATTFNRFCKTFESSCEQPAKWRVIY
ncbi:GDP-fucose protein O-fucosyltransferase 2-like isoform X2 [Paramacrobiotus metropolitanus]|uniref:GDP-fucose protein O-fucosyltransferase 2-like isoform X2 n=1 Tax=Paramacrobiotus metropolitanus TaxID=2943436 RepID=UPI0024458F00|nr:GDP-fucose protein O-fucosyltransferase 2-like isoform X2 [Paramacrobiotus metropolitanus]